jgi:predicted nuclease of predicted toxin-antitoxin system
VKILLDENLPRKLVAALRAEGHEVESIHTLRLQGLENGKLYEFARESFDLCFTRDAGFANNVRQGAPPSRLKLLRVTVQQKPQDEFVLDFIAVFRTSDWTQFGHGDDWPHSSGDAS